MIVYETIEAMKEENQIPNKGETLLVGEELPLQAYVWNGEYELRDCELETNILGHFPSESRLRKTIKSPKSGDIYIVGNISPYNTFEYVQTEESSDWIKIDDYEHLVMKHYKSVEEFSNSKVNYEIGDLVSVGEVIPFRVYEIVPKWNMAGRIDIVKGSVGIPYSDLMNVKFITDEGEILMIRRTLNSIGGIEIYRPEQGA